MSEQKQTTFRSRALTGFLRLFFHHLYHSFSWTYGLVSSTVSLGRWNRWILAAAKLAPGPRVLELGFGPGHLQAHLAQKGMSTFGLDESKQMARQASRRLKKVGLIPQLVQGQAQHLPFASSTFDSVIATFPTLYIVDPDTLLEIRRVLKSHDPRSGSGRLVVLNAAWLTGNSLPERIMQSISQATAQVPPEDMDLTQFLEPFQQAGFQASLRFIDQENSRLLFILATKPS